MTGPEREGGAPWRHFHGSLPGQTLPPGHRRLPGSGLGGRVGDHAGVSAGQCAESMGEWLGGLRGEGLIWAGDLSNANGQTILAAALTKTGRELVNR